MKSKTNNRSNLAKFVATLGLFVTVLPATASAAPQTYCQEEGHGANGCSDLFEGGGYCWTNETSDTGYVCREEEPPKESQLEDIEEEVIEALDPIYDVAGGGGPGYVESSEA